MQNTVCLRQCIDANDFAHVIRLLRKSLSMHDQMKSRNKTRIVQCKKDSQTNWFKQEKLP